MRALFVAGLILCASPAAAQDKAAYPSQPIRIVVSVPAGGGVDSVTRIVAERLRQRFGQPVVVENRGGQAGNFGAEAVFAAQPDGYTLLASQPAPLTVNQLLYKKLNYDPRALTPVAIMTLIPNVLAVRPDFPARDAAAFIAYAKANPGKLNYASQGSGTTSHLTAELFQARTGIKLVHVPYKGTAPALNDLIGSQVDLMFTEMASVISLHNAGKARILALATANRSPLLPDVPTLSEAGVPDFETATWNAITAPPGTPADIVATLNTAITESLKLDDVQAQMRAFNVQTSDMKPDEVAAFIAADARRWADVIKFANVQAE